MFGFGKKQTKSEEKIKKGLHEVKEITRILRRGQINSELIGVSIRYVRGVNLTLKVNKKSIFLEEKEGDSFIEKIKFCINTLEKIKSNIENNENEILINNILDLRYMVNILNKIKIKEIVKEVFLYLITDLLELLNHIEGALSFKYDVNPGSAYRI